MANVLNLIGLLLNLLGVWCLYKNSPLNLRVIDKGLSVEIEVEDVVTSNQKNKKMKHCVYAILIGTFLQLISQLLNILG